MKTTNNNLDATLGRWLSQLDLAANSTQGSTKRHDMIKSFCKSFVPHDVSEEDMLFYANSLHEDEEFFLSIRRDIASCYSGELVESIQGDQIRKAIYTVKPPPGTLSEDTSLDLVREVTYISTDNGITWTAEG